MPKVSILLPNLNNRRFLPERLESISRQTFQDWEMVVVDGFSTDGAWELLQEYARREPRVSLFQLPPSGIYAAWNDCIERAACDYIYIATNDDTMEPDCLEKLAAALDAHPECDLAHCCLTFIDEQSRPVTHVTWDDWPPVKFAGSLISRRHVRPPGYDAVIACALKNPYYSVTQLLIRRGLFARGGLFEKRWGSFCDLEWQMRASLLTSTVHVPEYLATWRMHSLQSTSRARYCAAVKNGWMVEMVDSAIAFSKRVQSPGADGLPRRLRRFFEAERFHERWQELSGRAAKLKFILETLARDPAGFYYLWRDRRRRWESGEIFRDIREELARLGIPAPVAEATERNPRNETVP